MISEHPGAGGIRFNLPKRQKMQQDNQNSFNPQNQARFMGPRGPHPPMGQNKAQQPEQNSDELMNGNNNEKNENDSSTQAK